MFQRFLFWLRFGWQDEEDVVRKKMIMMILQSNDVDRNDSCKAFLYAQEYRVHRVLQKMCPIGTGV